VYGPAPDVASAQALAGGRGRTLVYYGCSDCADVATPLAAQLASIEVTLDVRTFPSDELATRLASRGEPFDLGLATFRPALLDPEAVMRPLLDGRTLGATGNTDLSSFSDDTFDASLDAAAALGGDARAQAFAALDADVMTNQAPIAPFATPGALELVSARVGCVGASPAYGADLAAICPR
jgi:peptide/nickel transport system substrate-binding protein